MQDIQNLMTLVSDQVGELAQSDVVLGDPITLGDVTLVPLSRVSVGFGAGGGTGEADTGRKGRPKGHGTGGGGGGGGKIRPVGVIVFRPDGVEVHALPDKPGLLDKLFDKLPGFIEKIQALMDGPAEAPKPS